MKAVHRRLSHGKDGGGRRIAKGPVRIIWTGPFSAGLLTPAPPLAFFGMSLSIWPHSFRLRRSACSWVVIRVTSSVSPSFPVRRALYRSRRRFVRASIPACKTSYCMESWAAGRLDGNGLYIGTMFAGIAHLLQPLPEGSQGISPGEGRVYVLLDEAPHGGAVLPGCLPLGPAHRPMQGFRRVDDRKAAGAVHSVRVAPGASFCCKRCFSTVIRANFA